MFSQGQYPYVSGSSMVQVLGPRTAENSVNREFSRAPIPSLNSFIMKRVTWRNLFGGGFYERTPGTLF